MNQIVEPSKCVGCAACHDTCAHKAISMQIDAEGFPYSEIKSILAGNEKVLVCGTPCQMAALRSFLKKDYDNLIIVDFICRGVNSPKVYRKYLDSLERKFGGKVVYVKAKNKELGWRNLTRKVVFDNGKSYYGVRSPNAP